MPQTSDSEFYSLSLNSIAPPPYSAQPSPRARNVEIEKNGDEQVSTFSKALFRQFTPPAFLSDPEPSHHDIETASSTAPKGWNNKLAHLVINWWLWELISWSMSAFCIVAIALLLGYYDGRAVPDRWPLGITLNTYISVLSGIAKYTLAVPVEEALGQLKWHWFAQRPRPLIDLERFDDASRGPWGAFALLVHTKGRSIASLGAIVTILSLALDPFFQQLVSLPKRPSLFGESAVPRIVNFTTERNSYKNGTEPENDFIAPDRTMQDAVFQFMVNDGTERAVNAFCPTEDCTWKPFDTLAMCSKCVDVATMLEFGCFEEPGDWRDNVTVNDEVVPRVVSCGYFLNATSDNPILMTGYTLNPSGTRDEASELLLMRNLNLHDVNVDTTYWGGSINFRSAFPLVDYLQVAARDAASVFRNDTPVARECVIQWCTQRIVADYDQGNYSEQVISEHYDTEPSFDALDFGEDMVFFYYKNFTIIPPNSQRTFFIPNITTLATIFLFQDFFPAYLVAHNESADQFLRTRNLIGEEPKLWKYSSNPFALPNVGDAFTKNMTTAVTNIMRTYPGSSEMFKGTGSVETYIRARWGFFALPLSLICFTLALLLAVIVSHRNTQNVGVWKSSLMAALANGLSDDVRNAFTSRYRLYDIFEHAVQTKVMLQGKDGGYSLVLANDASITNNK